jgi:small subunit ribosomal protein S13e
MGKMLGPGISGSALPFRRKAPAWTTMSPSNITDLIVRNAKKGLTPSQIGVLMRDAYGIPQVRFLTGKKILRILKKRGCAPSIPEDLYHLIKKAVAMRKHLNKNRKDIDCKFRLVLSESRIHRLTRYYKRTGQVTPTWK